MGATLRFISFQQIKNGNGKRPSAVEIEKYEQHLILGSDKLQMVKQPSGVHHTYLLVTLS